MTVLLWIGAGLGLTLGVYLLVALVHPEWF